MWKWKKHAFINKCLTFRRFIFKLMSSQFYWEYLTLIKDKQCFDFSHYSKPRSAVMSQIIAEYLFKKILILLNESISFHISFHKVLSLIVYRFRLFPRERFLDPGPPINFVLCMVIISFTWISLVMWPQRPAPLIASQHRCSSPNMS